MNYRLRRSLVISALSLSLLTSGCGILLPKQVELFQRKVKAVPELSESAKETQRQAADRINREISESLNAAMLEGSSTNVTKPLSEANTVSGALVISLGPPASPYYWSSDRLALTLKRNTAELNSDIVDYSEHVDKDVGKKIEGTGLFRVGYFTMIGGLLALAALVWFGLRVYGIFNPVVGGVTSVIGRVSGSILNKGFTQVVAGGEYFKDMLEKSNLDEKTAGYVKQLFTSAQKQAQDSDVKEIVKGITQYPDTTPIPSPQ